MNTFIVNIVYRAQNLRESLIQSQSDVSFAINETHYSQLNYSYMFVCDTCSVEDFTVSNWVISLQESKTNVHKCALLELVYIS